MLNKKKKKIYRVIWANFFFFVRRSRSYSRTKVFVLNNVTILRRRTLHCIHEFQRAKIFHLGNEYVSDISINYIVNRDVLNSPGVVKY